MVIVWASCEPQAVPWASQPTTCGCSFDCWQPGSGACSGHPTKTCWCTLPCPRLPSAPPFGMLIPRPRAAATSSSFKRTGTVTRIIAHSSELLVLCPPVHVAAPTGVKHLLASPRQHSSSVTGPRASLDRYRAPNSPLCCVLCAPL